MSTNNDHSYSYLSNNGVVAVTGNVVVDTTGFNSGNFEVTKRPKNREKTGYSMPQ